MTTPRSIAIRLALGLGCLAGVALAAPGQGLAHAAAQPHRSSGTSIVHSRAVIHSNGNYWKSLVLGSSRWGGKTPNYSIWKSLTPSSSHQSGAHWHGLTPNSNRGGSITPGSGRWQGITPGTSKWFGNTPGTGRWGSLVLGGHNWSGVRPDPSNWH